MLVAPGVVVGVVIVLVLVGLVLWAVSTVTVIDPTVKRMIYVVVVVATVLWLLQAFGLLAVGTPARLH